MESGNRITIAGRLIRDFGLDRDEIVVATKVHFDMRPGRPNGGGSSRKNIMAKKVCSFTGGKLDFFTVLAPKDVKRVAR